MNYVSRRPYGIRYGSRRAAAAKWLLVVVTVSAAVVAFARNRNPNTTPTKIIFTASATANEPAPTLSVGILQMLQSAALASSPAFAYVVPPGASQPQVLPVTPFLADGQVDYGPTRISVLHANLSAVQQAVEDEATRGQFDLLTTLAAAIKAAPPPATLVVISSGLSTVGGFDLRQVGWDASPSSVAAQLKGRGLLPDLAGYQVVFTGLGDTAGRQTALPLPQQTTLTSYWVAICQASSAASCSIDDTDRPEPPSRSIIPVPLVPVPVVTSVRGTGNSTITSLPDSLLFLFDSFTLVPAADTILQPLAQRAHSQRMLVSIVGYASPDGGTHAFNQVLSERRADAVRNRLVDLGLPADQITQVMGLGTAGHNLGACLIHGQLDEAICAQFRRVVIILSPVVVTS